jgi:hypothetical protein
MQALAPSSITSIFSSKHKVLELRGGWGHAVGAISEATKKLGFGGGARQRAS